MPDILHRLTMQASPEAVYDAITTSEGVRCWWTRDADLELEPGGTGQFRFPHYGPDHVHQVVVEERDRPHNVLWRVTQSFLPQWVGTRIAFRLTPADGGTTLGFAHTNFPEADDVYAMCTTGWAYYLVSLKQYVETGTGAPSPDEIQPHALGVIAAFTSLTL